MTGFKRYNRIIRLFITGLLVVIFLLVQFVFRGQDARFSSLFANDKIVLMIDYGENAAGAQDIDLDKFYFSNSGKGSYYGKKFHNRKTASGERYNMNAMTAAHKNLPFGTIVRVVNEDTGLRTLVRINDRGPFSKKRVIDLSKQAAESVNGLGLPNLKIEALVIPNDFNFSFDKKFYFGYSLDFPLLIAAEDEIDIIDSANSFSEAFTKYNQMLANTKLDDIYLFVDFQKPYFASSEGIDYRYYIAFLGKVIPPSRKQQDLSLF